MKNLVCFICLIGSFFAYAQNYKLIDNNVKNYQQFETIDELVLRVNNSFESDEEKARAYFTWISLNILYDLEAYYSIRGPEFYVTFESERMNRSIEKYKRKQLAKRVFIERKGLCLGLSALFQELCKLSGIEVQIIEGIIKSSANDINDSSYVKNHAWNAVKIKGQWQLIDLTFSSGYENSTTGTWELEFNDFYFFTEPIKLLHTHFPADIKFQLVDNPISVEFFFNQPMFYSKYFDCGLEISDKQQGFVNVAETGDKIYLEFKNRDVHEHIYYKFSNETYTRQLQIKKTNLDTYVTTLKYKSRYADVLSLYYENEKILDFKIQK